MKIAIIGSGIAAFGAVSKIIDLGIKGEISIFDNHQITEFNDSERENLYHLEDKNKTIKQIRKKNFSLIPPKSSYGLLPNKISNLLYDSNLFGGLSTFWGGTLGVFSPHDLRNWPIEFSDLKPYYSFISKKIFITRPSENIFGDISNIDFQEKIKTPFIVDRLHSIINSSSSQDGFIFKSGYPMLAASFTDLEHYNCEYPGKCTHNCKNHSTFKTYKYFNKIIKENNNIKYFNNAVEKIDTKHPLVYFQNGEKELFDKIYLCSGAINTSKILINSFNIKDGLKITDNGLIQFPIFSSNEFNTIKGFDNFSLTNLVIKSCSENGLSNNQWQVMQVYEYLFEYLFPTYLSSVKNKLYRALKDRVLILRGYTDHEESNIYNINKDKNSNFILECHKNSEKNKLNSSASSLRKILSNNNFRSIPLLNVKSKTSGHYGSSIPYKEGFFGVPINGELLKNVFICDSSVFNSMPSTSPTFTIMANAARTAELSFNKY